MKRLKLAALDSEDLGVLSAYTQDGVLKVGDIRYSKADHRVIFEINRFVWEGAGDGKKRRTYERRRSVLHFARVNAVRSTGIDQSHRDGVLNLLSMRFVPFDTATPDDPSGVVELSFSGDGTLHLLVECVEAQLTDLDASWETLGRPKHA
ncbi:MAG: DUF2948 family protein [Pseudomonadota bacterium]